MADKTMISVCVASYNGQEFIEEQLSSILVQLSPEDEVIISDNGSTDETIAIIERFNDKRIKLFHYVDIKGIKDNFENALKQANGNLIFLADQDDIWEKEKISTMTTYLKDYDLVVSDCSIIDLHKNIITDSFYELRQPGRGIFKNIQHNSYMGCCIAFRSSLLKQILPLPAGVALHDWWIGLIAELFGTTFFCPEKLVYYRRHETNQSPLVGQSPFNFFHKLRARIYLVFALLKVWVRRHP